MSGPAIFPIWSDSVLSIPVERRSRLLLLALPAAIAIAQLSLLTRGEVPTDLLVMHLLSWLSAALCWQESLRLPTMPPRRYATCLASVLLLWSLLVISRPHTLYDPLLNAVPLATLAGLSLVRFGTVVHGTVLLASFPLLFKAAILLAPIRQLARLTAEFSAQLLWLAGVPALAIDDHLLLSRQVLAVAGPCTGINAMVLCLASALALLQIQGGLPWRRSLLLLFGAPGIAFLVNALRIAVLALLPVEPPPGQLRESTAFHFWHLGAGSTLFALIAVLLVVQLDHQLRRGLPSPVEA